MTNGYRSIFLDDIFFASPNIGGFGRSMQPAWRPEWRPLELAIEDVSHGYIVELNRVPRTLRPLRNQSELTWYCYHETATASETHIEYVSQSPESGCRMI